MRAWSLLSLTIGLFCLTVGVIALPAAPACADLSPPLSVEWTFSMEPDPTSTAAPLLHGEQVYLSHGGDLHCLDARTGAERWKFSPEPAQVTTSPIIWQNLIVLGASDACVYGLNAMSGRQQWRRICAGSISRDPLLLNGQVMVAGGNTAYGIDPRSGAAEWSCPLDSAPKKGPVTDGSMLYFLCQDSTVQCIDPDIPRLRWTQPVERGPSAFGPMVAGRNVIVASGNKLVLLSRTTGNSRAKEMPAGIGAAPTLADDTLFVPSVDGEIYTLYPRSAARKHGPSLSVGLPVTAAPLVTRDYIVAATASGVIHLLDRNTGAVRWAFRCVAPEQPTGQAAQFGVYAPVVSGDDRLYCLSGTGDLYCFSPSAQDSSGPRFTDLEPEPGSAIGGGASVGIVFAVVDDGSGVDRDSITATLDGVRVAVSFDAVTGAGNLTLSKPADGPHVVKVTARDYRGNVGTAEWSFLTDESLAPPEEEAEARTGLLPRQR
jgi:outer membrane protein assembly factor BamB